MRKEKALKKAEKAAALWGEEGQSWKKHARCGLCSHRFVVNNYPDRLARVSQHKIGGVIVCPWCRGRGGRAQVQALLLVRFLAGKTSDEEYCGDDEKCKHPTCQARRLLTMEFPHFQTQRSRFVEGSK